MIKVVKKNKKDEPIKLPCLMKGVSTGDIYYILKQEDLYSTGINMCTGELSTQWGTDMLEKFNGSITLTNED